jgi:hypothetical protein
MVTAPYAISYDRQDTLLHFQTMAEGVAIRCAVSRAALALLEDDALGGSAAMATTYHRNKGHIHRLALKKYFERQLERDGIVVVRWIDVQAYAKAVRS